MAVPSFAVTWDYRCPFARNAHEHLLLAMGAGAGWQVTFVPFSLNQVHIDEGDPDVWDNPAHARSLLAMQVGIAVRDLAPELFPKVHWALFAARHDEGRDIRERDVLRDVLEQQRADADAIFRAVDEGGPMETFRQEHQRSVADHRVFGVPTFVTGGRAAFVRVMSRPDGDAGLAARTVERVVDAVANWTELNELKHTSIPR